MDVAGESRSGAAERISGSRQGQFKSKSCKEAESARRHAALVAQQSEGRANRIDEMRRISMEALIGGGEVNDLEKEVEVEEDLEDQGGMGDEAMGSDDDTLQQKKGNKMRRLRRLHRTLFFARQLQAPDWMVDVPEDLSKSWMMMVRPEGDRCLLMSDGGKVEVRRKNGFVQERYTDARMPRGLTILDVVCVEGAPESKELAQDDMQHEMENFETQELEIEMGGDLDGGEDKADVTETVVDVTMTGSGQGRRARGSASGRGRGYSAGGHSGGKARGGKGKKGENQRRRAHPDRKYAVCDVMFWDGTDLVGADTECRMYWLSSRFAELPEKTPRKARPLVLIPAVDVTAGAIDEAYRADVGYSKDSLLFMHRQAHYAMDSPITPLALMWRDRQISRFVIDTPDEKGEKLPTHQAVVLEIRGNGFLRTAERAVVAQLDENALSSIGQDKNKSRCLIRCEIDGVDINAKKLVGVKPLMVVPARSRVWPDSWGRILFQHMHRNGITETIRFETLARAAAGISPITD